MTEVQTPVHEEAARATIRHGQRLDKIERKLVQASSQVIAWTALPFAASVSDLGTPYHVCQYMRDAAGWVHVRGVLKCSVAPANGGLLATLPAGCRPSAIEGFSCIGSSSTFAAAFAIEVNAAGSLNLYFTTGVAWNGGSLYISGVSFATN